jgi:opacity protein-like surface antigen
MRLSIVAIAALVAPPVFAAEISGFYLGADAGVTRADTRKNNFDQVVGVPTEVSTLDDRDTTYGITAGYRVDSWLAVEASYLDLGQVKYELTQEAPGGPGSATIEPSGLALSALVIGDMGNVDLFARVGVFYADTDYRLSDQSGSNSFSDSTEEFFWGLGGNYQFADRWSARIEYRNFDKVGDSSSPVTADVNTLTLGIVYTFNRQ